MEQESEKYESIEKLATLLGNVLRHPIPYLPFNSHELPALYYILGGYRGYLSNCKTPLSDRQRLHLRTLDQLQKRFSQFIALEAPEDHMLVVLSLDDLETISEALEVSVHLLPRLAPPSKDRDEVITGARKLGEQIHAMLDQHSGSKPQN